MLSIVRRQEEGRVAQRAWDVLLAHIRRSCGADVAESLEQEPPDWFGPDTGVFHLVVFRKQGRRPLPALELGFTRESGRWRHTAGPLAG